MSRTRSNPPRKANPAEDLFGTDGGAEGLEISRLGPLKSRPGWVSVIVDRRRVASLEARQAQELGLVPGVAWTSELASRVENASAYAQARRDGERIAARRAVSKAGLVDALARRGHGRALARRVADELEAAGLIDERVMAEGLVRSELARRPAGGRLLEAKLRQKGIDQGMARQVARDAVSGRDALEDALALASRRAATMQGRAEPEAMRRRLYGYLARRGFEPEVCRRATERAVGRGD